MRIDSKHNWEVTDSCGHEMQCHECEKVIYFEDDEWGKEINAECPAKKGLVPVGVAVIVVKDDKILMGKRISNKGHADGKWQLPGGKMEWMESPFVTCKRETREESGVEIHLHTLRPIGFENDCWPEIGVHFVCLFYIAEWAYGEPKVMEPDKCSEWRWIKYDELPENENSFFNYRNYIKEIEKFINERKQSELK